MSLFSTSNITCNERSSVGRNFRDTVNESSSPINRFTEKPDTRSFDEIFYEADIIIREASNSMNKLWYKTVLESDTVESAIINEANIFSKLIEVIKTIFDAIKKAISSWVKKAKTLLQKIFKKKPANKSDSKGESKDSENTEKASKSDVRNTDKESTPTDKVEEIKSKKDELEREKKELESKLKEAKKNEEKKKKDESQSGNDKDKGANSSVNSSDDSIGTSNIDTSSPDTSNKKSQSVEMDTISSVPEKEPEKKSKGQSDKMDVISVPELEKKSKEIDDELKKVNAELKTAEKEASAIPQSKPTSSSTTPQSQSKEDTKSSSENDDVSVLYNKYISDIEGNWEVIDRVFERHYKNIKNGPKITPYIDLFRYSPRDYEGKEINLPEIFKHAFGSLWFSSENNYTAIDIVSKLLYADSANDIEKFIDRMVSSNSFTIEDYKKHLNSSISVTDRDKDKIAAGFVYDIDNLGLGLRIHTVSPDQLKSAEPWIKNLDNAFKGGELDKIKAEPPVDKTISEFNDNQISRFLDNIRGMKKNTNGYMLKHIEGCLQYIDGVKNTFITKANVIMSTIKNKTQELTHNTDAYQYYCNEFMPVIQKSIVGCVSSVAGVINQVLSMRIKIYTEAYTKGNTWFESCLKLCIADELASTKKK